MFHLEFVMLTEEIKKAVHNLAAGDLKELENLLVEQRFQNDPEFWRRMRLKTANYTSTDRQELADLEEAS